MSMNGGTLEQLSGLLGSPSGRFNLLYAVGYLSCLSTTYTLPYLFSIYYTLSSLYALLCRFFLLYLFMGSRKVKVREVGIEPTFIKMNAS